MSVAATGLPMPEPASTFSAILRLVVAPANTGAVLAAALVVAEPGLDQLLVPSALVACTCT